MSTPIQPNFEPQPQGQGKGYPTATAMPPQPPKKKRRVWFWVLLAVLVVLLIVVVSCSAIVAKGVSDAVSSAGPVQAGGSDASPAGDEPSAASQPKKDSKYDKLSAEQQDAYGSAQDYLESQGFSKQGLIDQLDSDAGSKYSKKDATAAVGALDEDWNKQAVRVAKEYRESQHFSTQGLIDQLESGSQFTHDQAVYGAKHSR